MKIKQNNEGAKKPKAQILSDKGKFKKKEVATNGKVQKSAKLAADLIKGDSLNEQVNIVKPTKIKGKKNSGGLNPAQVGLIVDDLLSKKNKKPENNSMNQQSSDSSPSPKKKNKKQKNQPAQQMVQQNSPQGKNKKGKKQNGESSEIKNDKKGNKRKAEVEQPVGDKKKKGQSGDVEKKEYNPDDFKLVPKDVLSTVNAALELHKKHVGSSKKLLNADPQPVFVKFSFYHSHPMRKVMRFELDHSPWHDSADVCLIVSDMPKSKNEETAAHWKEQMKKNGFKNISEVIPIASLRKDYIQYSDKKKLGDRFDVFLVESNVYARAFGLLGSKNFHDRRKTPTPVKLKTSIKNNIEHALKKVSAMYRAASMNFTIQVGHTGMKNKEIQENILRVWRDYPTHFGVLWDNVEKACLLVHELPELPIFCSLYAPLNGPTVHDKLIWAKANTQPIIGEHPTKLDQKVLVYPSGKVVVKAPPQKELTKEELAAKKLAKKQKEKERKLRKKNKMTDDDELDSDDSIGGRIDMLESQSESEEEEEEVKPKVKAEKKQKLKQLKGKEGKKVKKEESEEDSESDVEKAEQEYLQQLAAQKKPTKGKESKKQQKKEVVKEESSDDDSDEEDVNSDGLESDDGEDIDSDDVMDETNFENDDSSSEEEEDVKPKFNGKGKKQKQLPMPKGGMKESKKKQKPANKAGAQKQSSPPQNKKQKNAQQPQTGKGKPLDKNSFQGVKADQGGKKKNKIAIKNKAIAKKLK